MTLEEFLGNAEDYVDQIRNELHARWESWELDMSQREKHEVVGALMARNVTLATQLTHNPGIWNSHIAPIILRSMVDVMITFSWICLEPQDRAQKFIMHGLGQEKLQVEHLKNLVSSHTDDPDSHPSVEARKAWIDSQKFTFLTEVDAGSWSGESTRSMAQEADCMKEYRNAYQEFSGPTHSRWNHVARHNMTHCENPLHQYHRVPVDPPFQIEPGYLLQAALYVRKTFDRFDELTDIDVEVDSGYDTMVSLIDELHSDQENEDPDAGSSPSEASA